MCQNDLENNSAQKYRQKFINPISCFQRFKNYRFVKY